MDEEKLPRPLCVLIAGLLCIASWALVFALCLVSGIGV